jgi:predicted TIM-barrel fold metal-dependent hydrolase
VTESLEKMAGITEASRRKILAENATRLYGIEPPRISYR